MDNATDYRLDVVDKRLDSHGQRLDEYSDLVTRLTIIEEQNQRRLDEQEERIKALESVPAERWDGIVQTVISVCIGAVIGFIVSKLGL